MRVKLLAVAAGLGLVAGPIGAAHATAAASPAPDATLVITDKGAVRGTVTATTREFQGIPYAAPPVGALRWGSPQPAKPWVAPRDATKPADGCAQNSFLPGDTVKYSEDCLYLNVTTPRRAGHRKLPVMVWIHGGAFQNGYGHGYRPREMAVRGDVIVVTINYRLGVFGFLDHPALDRGQARQRSGNFGLEDQQAALRWVRRNAGAFGGDARNLTVFGQSSGARSVCTLLASPAAAGLFRRAIIQSEPCTQTQWPQQEGAPDPNPPGFPRPRAKAEKHGRSVAAKLGCADPATAAACLRGLDTSKLLAATKLDFLFAPVFGGGLLPVDPARAIAAGRFAKVPVMHGITRDEYRISDAFLELSGTKPLTPTGYRNRVKAFVGKKNAPKVLALYPLRGRTPSEAWSAVVTDAVYARPMTDLNRALARQVPTYAYRFSDRQAPWIANTPKPSFPTGAFHTSELQYLFEADEFAGRQLTPAQQRLAAQMIRYWTRFAHTGNPGWLRADRNTSVAQSLDDGPRGIRLVSLTRDHNYRFWGSLHR